MGHTHTRTHTRVHIRSCTNAYPHTCVRTCAPRVASAQVLCGEKNGVGKTAWNAFVAVLGLSCTFFGTSASMKSLAAKAASVAAGGA